MEPVNTVKPARDVLHGITFAVLLAIVSDGVEFGRAHGCAEVVKATAGAGCSLMFHPLYYTGPNA